MLTQTLPDCLLLQEILPFWPQLQLDEPLLVRIKTLHTATHYCTCSGFRVARSLRSFCSSPSMHCLLQHQARCILLQRDCKEHVLAYGPGSQSRHLAPSLHHTASPHVSNPPKPHGGNSLGPVWFKTLELGPSRHNFIDWSVICTVRICMHVV